MKKYLLAPALLLSLSASAQKTKVIKERVPYVQTYFECHFCGRHYLVPRALPEFDKIKNPSIQEELQRRAIVVAMLIKGEISDIRDSECNSTQSRNGKHEWDEVEAKSKRTYRTATLNADGSVTVE